MERLQNITYWLIGYIFIAMGICVIFFVNLESSLPVFAMSLLFIPAIADLTYGKFLKSIDFGLKMVLTLPLFFLFFILNADYVKQDKINQLHENKQQIVGEIKQDMANQEYGKAVMLAEKYLMANDHDISLLHTEATYKLNEQAILKQLQDIPSSDYANNKQLYQQLSNMFPKNQHYKEKYNKYNNLLMAENSKQRQIEAEKKEKAKKRKEADILAKLKKIPTSNFSENKKLYGELKDMFPANKEYKASYNKYEKLLADALEKQRKAETRKDMIEKSFSPWDGSHITVERAIKRYMQDADSYEHVETTYADKGDYLLVRTVFRGKNGFGAKVMNTAIAKVSLDGKVLSLNLDK